MSSRNGIFYLLVSVMAGVSVAADAQRARVERQGVSPEAREEQARTRSAPAQPAPAPTGAISNARAASARPAAGNASPQALNVSVKRNMEGEAVPAVPERAIASGIRPRGIGTGSGGVSSEALVEIKSEISRIQNIYATKEHVARELERIQASIASQELSLDEARAAMSELMQSELAGLRGDLGAIVSFDPEYLADLVHTGELDEYAKLSLLGAYATKAEVEGRLGNYVEISDLSDYATSDGVASAISMALAASGFASKTELGAYATKAEVEGRLGNYVEISDLSGYATSDGVATAISGALAASGFATEAELGAYATKAEMGMLAAKDRVAAADIENNAIIANKIATGVIMEDHISQDARIPFSKLSRGSAGRGFLGRSSNDSTALEFIDQAAARSILGLNSDGSLSVSDGSIENVHINNNAAIAVSKLASSSTANRVLSVVAANSAPVWRQVALAAIDGGATAGVLKTTDTGFVSSGTIATDNIADGAVTTAKITDKNVTLGKINGGTTAGVLKTTNAGVVSSGTIATDNMTGDSASTDSAPKFLVSKASAAVSWATLAVGDGNLANNTITAAKLKASTTVGQVLITSAADTASWGTVGTAGIADGAVTTAKITDKNVTLGKINGGTTAGILKTDASGAVSVVPDRTSCGAGYYFAEL